MWARVMVIAAALTACSDKLERNDTRTNARAAELTFEQTKLRLQLIELELRDLEFEANGGGNAMQWDGQQEKRARDVAVLMTKIKSLRAEQVALRARLSQLRPQAEDAGTATATDADAIF